MASEAAAAMLLLLLLLLRLLLLFLLPKTIPMKAETKKNRPPTATTPLAGDRERASAREREAHSVTKNSTALAT